MAIINDNISNQFGDGLNRTISEPGVKRSMVDYDIFISYRREGGREIARTIKLALEARGCGNIFFDYNSLRDGVFNEQIISAIQSCKDFILVLSDCSMDRCANVEDWVAREISTAIKYGCNIIPVKVNDGDWSWPSDFPDALASLKSIQFTTLLTNEYFDESIDRISKRLTKALAQDSELFNSLFENIDFFEVCRNNIANGNFAFEANVYGRLSDVEIEPLNKKVLRTFQCEDTVPELAKAWDKIKKGPDHFDKERNMFYSKTTTYFLVLDGKFVVKVHPHEGQENVGDFLVQIQGKLLTKDVMLRTIERMIVKHFFISRGKILV